MANTTVHSVTARVSGHHTEEKTSQRKLAPCSPFLYQVQSDKAEAPGKGQERAWVLHGGDGSEVCMEEGYLCLYGSGRALLAGS